MNGITVLEVEYIAHKLAQELMTWDESIQEFGSRFPNILESTLAVPFQKFGGKSAHKGLTERAATFFYVMIKNHPFQNGNKRIAIVALLYFLYKNNKWLVADNMQFYNFAKWVAASDPKVRKATTEAIKEFLRIYIKPMQ